MRTKANASEIEQELFVVAYVTVHHSIGRLIHSLAVLKSVA
ncbi:MAG TPA: hypothetical protein PK970_00600 [Hyphomicrobiaceae bacterium]|nr:hypothetical protein [Hyphomicrobiaceae bacterium]